MNERWSMNSNNLSKKDKRNKAYCIDATCNTPQASLPMSLTLAHGDGVFNATILLKISHESDVMMMMHHLSRGFTLRIRRHNRHATKTPRTKRER